MKQYIMIKMTIDNKNKADTICSELIKNKLVSCAQVIGPIESKYWWENKVQSDKEWICFFKTEKKLYKKVELKILELHDYEVPEILSFNIENGYSEYLNWISENTV